MTGQKISAFDVDVNIGGFAVNFENLTLTIDDKTAPQMSRGRPDGYTQGDVSASGEVEVDSANLAILVMAAQAAGSFQQMPPWDSLFLGKTPDTELRVEAYGCKFRISELLNAAQSSSDKLKHKLPFDVTSPDFVRINGVPYAEERGGSFQVMASFDL